MLPWLSLSAPPIGERLPAQARPGGVPPQIKRACATRFWPMPQLPFAYQATRQASFSPAAYCPRCPLPALGPGCPQGPSSLDPSKRPNPDGCKERVAFSIRPETFRGRFEDRHLCPLHRHLVAWTLRKCQFTANQDSRPARPPRNRPDDIPCRRAILAGEPSRR